MRVLVTGSAGFIGGYVVADLLAAGHTVVGIDDYSKYGPVEKSYDGDPRYRFVRGDAKDARLLRELLDGCDHMLAAAARIGGIGYFHENAYDLLAENERITCAHFDAAIDAFRAGTLSKVTVLSSSMVFENATVFPTPESHITQCPPPSSTYGFQKLATEVFARGAREQYGLPYTIVRPFNCVGIGEQRAVAAARERSGNVEMALSHVVPDLVRKLLSGQDPLRVLGSGEQVRHYTYGGDLARGIRMAMENPAAIDDDFNLSTPVATTVLELAAVVWRKIRGNEPLRYVSEAPFRYDVQRRSPDVRKAKEVLGFEATTSLEAMLDEVIPWVADGMARGVV